MSKLKVCPDDSVTVVMTTYNGAKFLEEQLQSILEQTVHPRHLIIADDCSSDTTIDIVTQFAKRAAFSVEIIRNPRQLGFADNFLNAAQGATTPFIAFCDQDDIWTPTKLEESLEAIVNADATLCVHAMELVDEAGSSLNRTSQGSVNQRQLTQVTLPLGCFYGCTMVFKAELLSLISWQSRGKSIHLSYENAGHDEWIEFLARSLGEVVFLDRRLIRYRQHSQNASGTISGNYKRRFAYILRSPAKSIQRQLAVAGSRRAHLNYLLTLPLEKSAETKLKAAIEQWGNIEALLEARLRIYSEGSVWRRFCALAALSRNRNAVMSEGWPRPSTLIKDAIVGVARLSVSSVTLR